MQHHRIRDKRLREFIQASGDRFWQCDLSLQLSWTSALGSALTTEAATQALPLVRAASADLLRALDSNQRFHDVVGVLQGHDGGVRHYRFAGQPTTDRWGRVRGYYGVAKDVTNEWMALRDADAAEHRLRAAFASFGAGFALFDPSGILVDSNARFSELLVLLGGRPAGGIRLEPLLMTMAARQFAPCAPVWSGAGALQIEAEVADGRWVRVDVHRMPDHGTVLLMTDITEQHQRETALALQSTMLSGTVESIAEALCVFDEQFRLLVWNDAFRRLFGLPPEMMRPGRRLDEFARFCQGELIFGFPVMEGLLRPLDMTAVNAVETLEWPRPDGSVLEVRRRWKPGFGLIHTFVDVTDRKGDERQLHHAKEQAEIANRAKTQFLAHMSHELRTPLNAIIGFSDILMSELLGPIANPQYLDYIRDIHMSGSHLLDVINDILDLSKIESGKYELNEKPVDLARIVHSAMRLVREKAIRGGLDLSVRSPDPSPVVLGDDRAFKQIMLNLLSNAVKFTLPGGSVEVTTTIAEDGGVVVEVADTGIGMAATDIPKALSPFGQVDSALARQFPGTGLGLPLARSLTDLHCGRLEVISTLGVGTRVRVCLPAARLLTLSSPERLALGALPTLAAD